MPSECAYRLVSGAADIGLIPIAALAANPGLRILPGCTIPSKGQVRSLLLVRRAAQPPAALRSVAADTASLTTIAHTRILFHHWGNPKVPFLPMAADLDAMLAVADAAILIGDPALDFALGPHEHEIWDLGAAWFEMTSLPFVYAVWALRRGVENAALRNFLREARDFGLDTLDSIIRTRTEYDYDFRKDYLGWHIHYHLGSDEKRGLAKFIELLRRHGCGPIFEPRFVV